VITDSEGLNLLIFRAKPGLKQIKQLLNLSICLIKHLLNLSVCLFFGSGEYIVEGSCNDLNMS